MAANREQLLKMLVVGECGTGKTCLIRYYMHGSFQSSNKATIGVDFALKVLPETNTTLQIWDIAGQERYGQMTRVYFLSAVGAMVVAEINKPETWAAAVNWKKDVDSKVFLPGSQQVPIPCMLLLNKCDLGDCEKTNEEIDEFCRCHGFVGWLKVSAKTGENVEQAFTQLIQTVQEKKEQIRLQMAGDGAAGSTRERQSVRLGERKAPKAAGEKSGCACRK